MKFQLKNVVIAAAAVGSMLAASAQAVTVTEARAGLQVRISGATAPTETFNNFILLEDTAPADGNAEGVFSNNTILRFTGSFGGDDQSITCGEITADFAAAANTTNGGGSSFAADDVVCIHKQDGGSGDGTGPVAAQSNLPFLDIDTVGPGAGGCAAVAQPEDFSGAGIQAYEYYDGCTAGINVPADAGIADVEPALFGVSSGLDSLGVFAIVWGMPVTHPLYRALQEVQFTGTCQPSNADYDTNASPTFDGDTELSLAAPHNFDHNVDYSAECQPSMKSQDIVSWMTGAIGNTLFLFDGNGTSLASNANVPTPGGGTAAYLARRRTGSGTQASYDALYLRDRCESGVAPMSVCNVPGCDNDAGEDGNTQCFVLRDGTVVGGTVFAGNGTGDVKECLTNATVNGYWALGIFSTENVPTTETALSGGLPSRYGYAHVKVDGIQGSLLNAGTGRYPWVTELVCNTPSGAVPGTLDSVVGRTICNIAPAEDLLATVNLANNDHPWGQGGVLGLNTVPGNQFAIADYPLDESNYDADPIWLYTNSLSGNTNNCQPSQIGPLPVPVN